MTDRELLQQALDALEGLLGWQSLAPAEEQDNAKAAAFRLRARLAQPNEFNPDWDAVAVMVEEQQRMAKELKTQREWKGLTDEEYEAMAEQYVTNCYFDTLEYAKAIEAKLKEKNG